MPPATVNCSTLQEQHREDPCHQAELNQMNMNQLLIPLLGLTGIPALLEFLEVKLHDEKEARPVRGEGEI